MEGRPVLPARANNEASESVRTANGGPNGRAGLNGVDREGRSGATAQASQRPEFSCRADQSRRPRGAAIRPCQLQFIVGWLRSRGEAPQAGSRAKRGCQLPCRWRVGEGSGRREATPTAFPYCTRAGRLGVPTIGEVVVVVSGTSDNVRSDVDGDQAGAIHSRQAWCPVRPSEMALRPGWKRVPKSWTRTPIDGDRALVISCPDFEMVLCSSNEARDAITRNIALGGIFG